MTRTPMLEVSEPVFSVVTLKQRRAERDDPGSLHCGNNFSLRREGRTLQLGVC